MREISLPAFHVTTTRKFMVEAPHEMVLELDRYRAFYKNAYGADVSDADLIRAMARRFMEADREFAAFKNSVKSKIRTNPKATTSTPEGSST